VSALLNDTAGATLTTGLSDYVVSGPLGDYNPIIGTLVNGTEYAYRVGFTDGVTSGRELVTGIYTLATNTLARTNVISSTNSDAKVNWAAGEKYVYIVGLAEDIQSMAGKTETATAKVMTDVERDKLAFVSVTQAVDLDTMETATVDNAAAAAANTANIITNTNDITKRLQSLPYKADGEANRVLFYGDSNALGIGGTDPAVQSANVNCFFYATPGTGAWNPANLAWRNVDPNAATAADIATGADPYVGLVRGSNGSTGFAITNTLQERTGVDSYCVPFAYSGCTSAYYLPGGGAGKEGFTSMLAHIPTALAAIPGAQTFFDVVVIQLGTNDANLGIMGAEFLSNMNTTISEMVTQGWIDRDLTQIFVCEPSQNFGAYIAGWDGLQYLINGTGRNVEALSSIDYPDAGDNTHFTPYSLNQFGVEAANFALIGPEPKRYLRTRNYVERLNPVISGDIVSGKTAALNVLVEKKSTDSGLPNDVTYGAQSAHDDATVGNRDGGDALWKGGDGAQNQNGNGGSSTLDGGVGFGTGSKGLALLGNTVSGVIAGFVNGTGEPIVNATPRTVVSVWSAGATVERNTIADEAAGTIEVPVAGTYFVFCNITVTGTASKTFAFYLFETTAGITFGPSSSIWMDAASTRKQASLAGFVSLTAGQKVCVKQLSTDGGTALTISEAQLGLIRVGE